MSITESVHGSHRQQSFSLCQRCSLNLLHTTRSTPWKEVVSRPPSGSRRCAWISIWTRSNKRRMCRVITIANMSSILVGSFSNFLPGRERMQSGSAECVFESVAILMPRQVILCQCRPRRYDRNSHYKNAGRKHAGGRRRRRRVLGARSGDMTFPNGPGRHRKWPMRYDSFSEIP